MDLYPGIRGQRARPVLCLIASALVFMCHKIKNKNKITIIISGGYWSETPVLWSPARGAPPTERTHQSK